MHSLFVHFYAKSKKKLAYLFKRKILFLCEIQKNGIVKKIYNILVGQRLNPPQYAASQPAKYQVPK